MCGKSNPNQSVVVISTIMELWLINVKVVIDNFSVELCNHDSRLVRYAMVAIQIFILYSMNEAEAFTSHFCHLDVIDNDKN